MIFGERGKNTFESYRESCKKRKQNKKTKKRFQGSHKLRKELGRWGGKLKWKRKRKKVWNHGLSENWWKRSNEDRDNREPNFRQGSHKVADKELESRETLTRLIGVTFGISQQTDVFSTTASLKTSLGRFPTRRGVLIALPFGSN